MQQNISQLFFFAIEAATCNAFSAKLEKSVGTKIRFIALKFKIR
jgi:hypothetical protein